MLFVFACLLCVYALLCVVLCCCCVFLCCCVLCCCFVVVCMCGGGGGGSRMISATRNNTCAPGTVQEGLAQHPVVKLSSSNLNKLPSQSSLGRGRRHTGSRHWHQPRSQIPKCVRSLHTLLGFSLYFVSSI